jgi:sigma-B regulation protein RsbU (phosphoserine phosphatase)
MNAYDTNDPRKLLALKRLEADALLDVLRTINHAELKISQLCLIVRNVLRAQLGVRKMAFFYLYRDRWKEGMVVGFDALKTEATTEMYDLALITPVTEAHLPALAQAGVEYVLPITNRSETTAFFLIADFADSEVEAQNDLIFIETLGNILAVAIHNRQLFQDKIEQEFLKRELEVAEAIQKQLLISDFSRFDDLDIYAINEAHHRVGGDFFDVIKKDHGITFVCIADVAGKGIGAALLMSNLQANLRALCAQYNDLPTIISELNRILYGITVGEKFVTLFLARIDTEQRNVRFINAGHNYPIFISQQRPQRLDIGCILLGIMPDIEPEEGTLSYAAKDVLFMFTDGVVEQTNPQEEMFSGEKVVAELLEKPQYHSRGMVEHIQNSLRQFAEQVEPADDITMLCVTFQ